MRDYISQVVGNQWTAAGRAPNLQPYDPKSYTLSICTAGASENGLADAGVNTHLHLEFG